MSRTTIGVVDYGVGNLASISHALNVLGYRSRTSSDFDVLGSTDLLLLPGVGAFPFAMRALSTTGLDNFIKEKSIEGKPIVGICLGMQLLADSSTEISPTKGLGLIPGEVSSLGTPAWHIGWNCLEIVDENNLLRSCNDMSVYFNHSYVFHAQRKHCIAVSRSGATEKPFTVAVQRENVVGLQFHPEKSQLSGREILRCTIEGLTNP